MHNNPQKLRDVLMANTAHVFSVRNCHMSNPVYDLNIEDIPGKKQMI